MKKITLFFLLSFCTCYAARSQGVRSLLLKGATIHTATGKVIENGAIGISGKTISFVGKASEVSEADYERVEDRTGYHIYPGMIAGNTTLGLTEIFAVRATRDFREVGDLKPNVRAIVAYDAESEIVSTVLSNGVLFAQICPRSGTISGTSSVVKLHAQNWQDAAYAMDGGIMMEWPRMYKKDEGEGNHSVYIEDEDYEEKIHELKLFFRRAQAYSKRVYPLERDLRAEAMKGVFSGGIRLFIEADFIKEIREVIGFKRELNIPKVTIVGGYDAAKAANLLRENDISVMVRRVNSLPRFPEDPIDTPFSLAATLADKGVLFSFQMEGGMEAMQNRNLAYNAGTAIGYGLSPEDALKGLTINAAKVLDIDERTGSIETGKEANLILTRGDLFELTTEVEEIYLQGEPISTDNRQKELYRKYLRRYDLEEKL